MNKEEELKKRRASAPEKINNASLPAGSPMYYYCKSCGHLTVVLPETWWKERPPKLCEFCTELGVTL